MTACDGAGDFVKMVVVRVRDGEDDHVVAQSAVQLQTRSPGFHPFCVFLFPLVAFLCVCIERIPGALGQVVAPGHPREAFFSWHMNMVQIAREQSGAT